MEIILGSSSPARAMVLRQLKIHFKQVSPNINEASQDNESPTGLVERLSKEKSIAIQNVTQNPALIITGDQILCCENIIFTKPKSFENAKSQLTFFSEKTAIFHTGLCVYNNTTHKEHLLHTETKITFKKLNNKIISNYLHTEQPYECAGSFRYEGLGIALISAIHSIDPYAILGMPLLLLAKILEKENIDIFSTQK